MKSKNKSEKSLIMKDKISAKERVKWTKKSKTKDLMKDTAMMAGCSAVTLGLAALFYYQITN